MTEERRLAAIMFSDICGFSRIMGENEQQALSFVSMHKDCLKDGTEIHGGRIIKEMGDGLLIEFSSAVNAVRCALAVQRAVLRHNNSAPKEEHFQLRIGIHVGDVVVSGEDILGDGVNVASRIEPLAEPGGICISRDIFDLVKNKISIETVHLGAHDLKNITQQVSIYKVLIDAVAPTGTISIPPKKKRPKLMHIAIAGSVVLLLLAAVSIQKRQTQDNVQPAPQTITTSQEKILRERHNSFIKAIINKDRETALSFLPPKAQSKEDDEKLWKRLSLMSALINMVTFTEEDIKINFIHISDDQMSADVIMQIRRGDEWNNTKPTKWILINGTWYIKLEPPNKLEQIQGDTKKMYPGFKREPGSGRRRM